MNLHEILEKRDKAENHFDSLMAMAQGGDLIALNQLPQACADLINVVGELAHSDFKPKFSSKRDKSKKCISAN